MRTGGGAAAVSWTEVAKLELLLPDRQGANISKLWPGNLLLQMMSTLLLWPRTYCSRTKKFFSLGSEPFPSDDESSAGFLRALNLEA